MASRRIGALALGVALAGAGAGAASAMPIGTVHAVARDAVHSARVGDAAEAWYSTPLGSLCLPIVGCLPLPLPLPSTYPAGTLHVGVTLGRESARAYVVPAVGRSRSGETATGGLLHLPVDSSPLAGTLDAGSARMTACLTTGRLPAGASATAMTTGTPPAVDCKVSAPVSYDRAGKYYFVDLTRFLVKWRNGTPDRGIALVPNLEGASPLANWQIALDGKGGPAPTVYSLLSYSATVKPVVTPSTSTGTPEHQTAPPPSVTVPLPGVGVVPPVSSPPAIASPAQNAVYFVRATGFRYPAIFIAPLAILAGVIFFVRLFTGPTARQRDRMTIGADSSDG